MTTELPQIRKLDDDLINKIAAGEVIERPASVIKELVENSIDAGSRKIMVSVKDGGKKLIKVADDGCGMVPDQLPLAVARHATSKITQFDDLYHLATKGFRGEALASIASIAKVSVASQTGDSEPTEILVEGGEIIDTRACAQPQGTTISVKYLFYQTPARLKFLKSNATEMSHIVDVMTRMALSHPHIEFKLISEDKVILEVPQNQDLKARTLSLLGNDLTDYLYSFEGEVPGMTLSGYLSHPQVGRSQRTQTYFFVNGRSVNDKVLWHATLEAYRDLLMKGRYPVMVLNLHVNEEMVDVNVHPTKAEIRFHQSTQVHHFVYRVLRDRLKAAPWLHSNVDQIASAGSVSDLENPLSTDLNVQQSTAPSSFGETNQKNGSHVPSRIADAVSSWSNRLFRETTPDEKKYIPNVDQSPNAEPPPQTAQQQRNIQFGKTLYADMNPIGQLFSTFILCETGNKLILIDQHAAHERVGFEKLMLQYQKDGIPSQAQLIPETFDLKPSDAEILKEYLDQFAPFGFEIEHFGGNTFVVKAVPVLLNQKIDMQRFLVDVIEDIKETGELVSLKDKLHHVLATMACHAQIRAHHHLAMDEMRSLLRELDEYQFTDFCPHGRPVSVEVTRDEIEKWFKRIL